MMSSDHRAHVSLMQINLLLQSKVNMAVLLLFDNIRKNEKVLGFYLFYDVQHLNSKFL